MIQLSYSSVSAYQDCPKRYYWQKLRNLELNRLHFPFLIGNAIQYGIHLIFKKDKLLDPIKETMKFFEEEREKARRQFFITEQQEQQFEEWKCIVEGM
ncbi:PD-(D/E)XK nuclease family protein, partial [Candidatus Roizmanbacteria bacterium]|nr:PD-(D/E)XK nuclease family protein [Candidatus Roizmanbacteria bacterium]